jgi:hypothetical protein
VNSSERRHFDEDDQRFLAQAAPLIGRAITPLLEEQRPTLDRAAGGVDGSTSSFLRRLAAEAFQGRPLADLCTALEHAIGFPLAVLTADYKAVYPPRVAESTLVAIAAHCSLGARERANPFVPAVGNGEEAVVLPIAAGSSIIGYVAACGVPVADLERALGSLQEAASVIASQAALPLTRAYVSPLATRDLLASVIKGTHPPAILREATNGDERTSVHRVILVRGGRAPLSTAAVEEVRRALAATIPGGMTTAVDGAVIHLVRDRAIGPAALDLLEHAVDRLDQTLDSGSLTAVCTGPFRRIEEVRRVYETACRLATLAETIGRPRLLRVEEIGVHELFLRVEDAEWRRDFIDRFIGPLLAYDDAHSTDLAKTLEVFLDENCAINTAAKKLYLHPNTLRYRLSKIRETLQNDLRNADSRLALHVAVKLQRVVDGTG